MALIKCPECKNKISEYASECVHCGWPVSEWEIEDEDIGILEDEEESEEDEDSAVDKMSKLIKDFTGEYGGLLAEILTRRELLKYYVENGFDDNDLEKKA